jgi:hypothetical protein
MKNPSLIQVRRVLTLDEAIEKCYKERWVDNEDGIGSNNNAYFIKFWYQPSDSKAKTDGLHIPAQTGQ